MLKIDKLLNLLSDGKNHSVKQITKKTGLESVSATVRDLRSQGFDIYLNVKGSKGEKQNFYRMAA